MAEQINMDNQQGLQARLAGLFVKENLQMVAIFVVVLAIAAFFSNLTVNNTLRAETAADVTGDVEDIGDEALDQLETLHEGIDAAVADLDITSDIGIASETIFDAIDEDVYEYVQYVGLYREENPLIFAFDSTTSTDEDGDEEISWSLSSLDDAIATEATNTLPVDAFTASEGDSSWVVGAESIHYATPLETEDGTSAYLWSSMTLSTITDLLAEGAAGEDLFADTDNGYTLLVTADHAIIASYNQNSASSEQVTALLDSLTEDIQNEDENYYEVTNDPLVDTSSFVSTMESPFNDWLVIGALPTDEVPTQDFVESTVNLFDASEVDDTISLAVADAFTFLNEDAGWLFRGFRAPIEEVIVAIEDLLLATHWSIIILATIAIAALTGGRQVAYIAAFGMFAIGMLGLWDRTMTTLAMLLTSMAFCILVGIPLGIWAARNDRVNEIVRSVLDAMQTIHPFVYLVPIAILFGIGKVPGTIATIIFALPPMVRLTNLGIRQVPEDVIEAARAFGSNDWQLLRDVQIPLAMPSIMAGVNQTLMLSLSMVVIVALIAGGGLGQEIYGAIQNSNIGRAVVAGSVVLLLAVVIDRISQGGSKSPTSEDD